MTKLMALQDQMLQKCGSDQQCKVGVARAVDTLTSKQCAEPLLSKCDQLNPYGSQDKGYVYGCKGIVTDILNATPESDSACDSKIINNVWQQWGNQKCSGASSKGECLFGINAGINAVMEKNNCSPYNLQCSSSAGGSNAFTACNSTVRSYLYSRS